MFSKLPLGRRTLFVIPASDPSLMRMVRNIQNVQLVTVNALGLTDVVGFPTLLFRKDAIPAFEKLYGAV
jgi:ribosomal protein L4